MRNRRVYLTAALVFALAAAGAAAGDVVHFALSRSAPAADATVAPPEEVRLWFTEAPQEGSVGIRLVDASGELVPATEPSADPDNALTAFIKPDATLGAGRYTVSWRGIGDDGHVVRGEFGFSVTAE